MCVGPRLGLVSPSPRTSGDLRAGDARRRSTHREQCRSGGHRQSRPAQPAVNTIEQLESGLITGEITEMQMLHPLDIESRPPPGSHTRSKRLLALPAVSVSPSRPRHLRTTS